ncbi:MAG: NAD(P)H-hydrate epimerase, partial [Alphaproteobacteria bacterium]|nr:NAD(P)H-hydrate epimerase [Alphaproteobacteria bacterium]
MSNRGRSALLSVAEMAAADRLAIAGGISGLELMEAAGRAVAAAVTGEAAARGSERARVVVLCGPGNNGGDGFVAALILAEGGHNVTVGFLGDIKKLPKDAQANAERWIDHMSAAVTPLATVRIEDANIVVDALFGAGLTRPLDGAAAELLRAADEARARGDLAIVAVDVPSGIDGNNGRIAGTEQRPGFAAHADCTVTFFRRKPGHLLLPGKSYCGAVEVADIGIPDGVLAEIGPRTAVNGPALWIGRYPWPQAGDHKYARGMA